MKNYAGHVIVQIQKNKIARKLESMLQTNEDLEDQSRKAQLTAELIMDKTDDATLVKLWNTMHGFTMQGIYSQGDFVILNKLPDDIYKDSLYEWKRELTNEIIAQVVATNPEECNNDWQFGNSEVLIEFTYINKSKDVVRDKYIVPIYDIVDTTGEAIRSSYMQKLHSHLEAH